jgi:hypothetical protein
VEKMLSILSDESIKQITVYTLTGSKLTVLCKIENGIYNLDFSAVKSGVYILKVNFENDNSVTRKIIRY